MVTAHHCVPANNAVPEEQIVLEVMEFANLATNSRIEHHSEPGWIA